MGFNSGFKGLKVIYLKWYRETDWTEKNTQSW